MATPYSTRRAVGDRRPLSAKHLIYADKLVIKINTQRQFLRSRR